MRRIARPEDVATPTAREAIIALGPPWYAHSAPTIARAMGASVLSLADWRYQDRPVPPREAAALYLRAKGHMYRADRVLQWMHDLSDQPHAFILWHAGRAYLRGVLGLPEAASRRELDDQILELQRSDALAPPQIVPAQWPNFRPYADRPLVPTPWAYEDDNGQSQNS